MIDAALPRRWQAAVIATGISVALGSLDTYGLTVALPDLAREFNPANPDLLDWMLTGFFLVVGIGVFPAGALADRIGAKNVLLVGGILFGLGSLVAGLAPNMFVLLGARVIEGLGGAGLVAASSAFLAVAIGRHPRRPFLIGLMGALGAMGLAFGPTIGGLLAAISWRWIFFFNIPIISVAMIYLLLAPAGRIAVPLRRVDPWLQILGAGSALGLCGFLIEYNGGPLLGAPLGFAIVAAVCVPVLCFRVWLSNACEPIRDLVRPPGFSSGYVSGALVSLVLYGVPPVFAAYLVVDLHMSTWVAGLAMIPLGLPNIGARAYAGRFIHIRGIRAALLVGSALMAVAFLFTGAIARWPGYALLLIAMISCSLAIASLVPASQIAIVESTPQLQQGTASGIFQATRLVAQATGVALMSGVVDISGSGTSAFLWIGVIGVTAAAILALVTIFFTKRISVSQSVWWPRAARST